MNLELKPGEPCVLKEGESPIMTVEKLGPDGKTSQGVIYVTWFNKEHNLNRDHFPAALLKRYHATKSP